MYKNKNDKKNNINERAIKEEGLELSLERAIEMIKQQANDYDHAGLTHISSLLN